MAFLQLDLQIIMKDFFFWYGFHICLLGILPNRNICTVSEVVIFTLRRFSIAQCPDRVIFEQWKGYSEVKENIMNFFQVLFGFESFWTVKEKEKDLEPKKNNK